MKICQISNIIFVFLAAMRLAYTADLTLEQQLGREIYNDDNLSINRNQSCASCHSLKKICWVKDRMLPATSFADPDNLRNGTPVSDGSIQGQFGTLNAPSAGYAAFSPFFRWDEKEGLYLGGQFWNGRAATLAEQARGPFLNPAEMAMRSPWDVVTRLKENRRYVRLFREIYGLDLDQIPPYKKRRRHKMPTRSTTHKIPPTGVPAVYDRMAQAIGEFEKSRVFNRFTSKFDYELAGMTTFSDQERKDSSYSKMTKKPLAASATPRSPEPHRTVAGCRRC